MLSKIIFSELSFYGKKSQKNADRIKNSLVISTNTIFNKMPYTCTNSIWFLFLYGEPEKNYSSYPSQDIFAWKERKEKYISETMYRLYYPDRTSQIWKNSVYEERVISVSL